MATRSAAEEISERKRVSIPKADESVLEWWNEQRDPGLSIRMLIRAEIERSGYIDFVYRPVSQQARRGRPPGSSSTVDADDADEQTTSVAALPQPAPQPVPVPPQEPQPAAVGAGPSAIDALMNG